MRALASDTLGLAAGTDRRARLALDDRPPDRRYQRGDPPPPAAAPADGPGHDARKFVAAAVLSRRRPAAGTVRGGRGRRMARTAGEQARRADRAGPGPLAIVESAVCAPGACRPRWAISMRRSRFCWAGRAGSERARPLSWQGTGSGPAMQISAVGLNGEVPVPLPAMGVAGIVHPAPTATKKGQAPSLRYGASPPCPSQASSLKPQASPRRRSSPARPTKPISIETIMPADIERFPWSGHLGTRLLAEVIGRIESARTTLVVHQHSQPGRNLVSLAAAGTARLGGRVGPASRLAGSRSAGVRRGPAAARGPFGRSSARRASTWESIFRPSIRCYRSAAPRELADCCNGPGGRGISPAPEPGGLRADARFRTDRVRRRSRGRVGRPDRGPRSGRSAAGRVGSAPGHNRHGGRVYQPAAVRRSAHHPRLPPAEPVRLAVGAWIL